MQINLAQATQILQAMPSGVLLLNPDRNIVWANDTCHTFFGMPVGSLMNKNLTQVMNSTVQRVLGQDAIYYVAANNDRAERWLHCLDARVEQGEARYFTDITELHHTQALQERTAQQLQDQATLDPSTGLFTTRALMQNLDPLVSRSRRYNNPLSLVVMAVVGLADYNALAEGPNAQQVLLAVGYMLKDQLRWADIISRTADNEFVMVLPETTAEQADKLIDKVRSHLVNLSIPGAAEKSYHIGVRFGVVAWQKGDDAQQLLRRAHSAVG